MFEDGVRICVGTELQGGCAVGRGTEINGATLYPMTRVGRYCSIARGAALGAPDHPLSGLSTNIGLPAVNALLKLSKTEIGHDVWVGANATVLSGCALGHGSVVAAGAVVTRDVRPYAIVAGVPASERRRRFPDEICEQLVQSRWWDLPPEQLARLPLDDALACADRFRALGRAGSEDA
ncbi:MAG: hypothetical protein JO048_13030 [Methylobacteriaceae bacterium]|nr:hypothetical protein [Methylobacteriaceae bacterium]